MSDSGSDADFESADEDTSERSSESSTLFTASKYSRPTYRDTYGSEKIARTRDALDAYQVDPKSYLESSKSDVRHFEESRKDSYETYPDDYPEFHESYKSKPRHIDSTREAYDEYRYENASRPETLQSDSKRFDKLREDSYDEYSHDRCKSFEEDVSPDKLYEEYQRDRPAYCETFESDVNRRDDRYDEYECDSPAYRDTFETDVKPIGASRGDSYETYDEEFVSPDPYCNVPKGLFDSKSSAMQRPELEDSKRVTLRLEKKLRQKNEQLLKQQEEKQRPATFEEEKRVEDVPKKTWGFGSWGTSLFSTAASSVSTFTNHVSHGIGTVFETVETSLGAPPPEELAAKPPLKTEIREASNAGIESGATEKTRPRSGILSEVSHWTKALESTGTKVLMGGLDTLEMIGKKTIDILTEGDPGLRKKRAAFNQEVSLSQVLREAKAKADYDMENSPNNEDVIHYSQCFDEYQGLVHLEALEMLSGQCQANIQRLTTRYFGDSKMKAKLEEIRQICEDLPPIDEVADEKAKQYFDAAFLTPIHALSFPVSVEKLMQVQKKINDYLTELIIDQGRGGVRYAKEIYQQAIPSLAEFTAKCVEQYHKVAEMLLVQPDLQPTTEHHAIQLTQLTRVLCLEVCIITTRFSLCLNASADDEEDPEIVTPLLTSVYLEASNSTAYIQEAYLLLVPVLQQFLFERSK